MTTEKQTDGKAVPEYTPADESYKWDAMSGDLPFWSPDDAARRSFFDDFLQVQLKIENPKRDSANPHFGNSYVSLESLLTYLRPILNGHGFTFFQAFRSSKYSNTQSFQTFLFHRDGSFLCSTSDVPELGSPQQVVSYSTYMRRVQLSALLGIRDESDDDGNSASASQAQAPWMTQQPSPPAPAQMPPAPSPSQVPGTPWQQQQQPAMQPPQPPTPLAMQPPTPPAPSATPQPQPPMPSAAPPPQPPAQAGSVPPPPTLPQQPMAAPPAPPEGAIQGEMLQEAQNMIEAVRNLWGEQMVNDILTRSDLVDISHMKHENYAPFVDQMNTFVTQNNKSMSLLGPESGNQVLIQ